MQAIRKTGGVLLKTVELYVPALMFLALFISFILQIVSRYLFRNPLVWPYEVAQFGYVWVILLGAGYCSRDDDHIVFSVVYESVPERLRTIFDYISDVLTLLIFGVSIPALVSFYAFFFTRFSTVLRIPLGLVYLPFGIYTVSTMFRVFFSMVDRARASLNKRKSAAAKGGEAR